ncbi:HAD family hydrolase [Bacillus sp. P14.5]|uniref:HAD family hydrolase n=1 Tax=Bacillus sp. P14.5 TaxID=1983400 RepID=UPI000DEA2944|nr:HAD family hydrolase [Bacillus sp. P14.5]
MLFDLDDTLLHRDEAVDNIFTLILENCYEEVGHSAKIAMRQKFKEYDKSCYGNNDKTKVLNSLYANFPPKHRLADQSIQDFWNEYFPKCFSINHQHINIINTLKNEVKVAIITNGSTQRQKAKIRNTRLNNCFDIVVISEEAGFSKPDKRIFESAIEKLNVKPGDALFVGDDIYKDIGGSQNAGIKGIWFNPHRSKNDTDIKPYAEIQSLEELLHLIQILNFKR